MKRFSGPGRGQKVLLGRTRGVGVLPSATATATNAAVVMLVLLSVQVTVGVVLANKPCARGQTDLKNNGTCTDCKKGQYTVRGHTGACTHCAAGETDDDKDPATACVQCSEVSALWPFSLLIIRRRPFKLQLNSCCTCQCHRWRDTC